MTEKSDDTPIANWCAGCGVEGHSDEDPHGEPFRHEQVWAGRCFCPTCVNQKNEEAN
jgi:hypothetical protein